MEKEATIEEKIRLRKKKRSMERAEQTRRREQGQPKKKKMKLDKECAGDKEKEENRWQAVRRRSQPRRGETTRVLDLRCNKPRRGE